MKELLFRFTKLGIYLPENLVDFAWAASFLIHNVRGKLYGGGHHLTAAV